MAALILRHPWTQQPQYPVGIDWGNPITRGLVSVLQGNSFLDQVNFGRAVTKQTNTILQPSYAEIGYKGAGTDPQGINVGTGGLSQIVAGNSPVTVAMGVIPFATGVREAFCADYSAAGSGASIIFEQQVANTYRVGFASGTVAKVVDTGTVEAGRLAHICGTHDLTTINGYINGVAGTPVLCGNRDAGNTLRVGAPGAYTGGIRFRGWVLYWYVWNRTLSAAEVKSLSDNPRQIFQPQTSRIWVPSAGGAAEQTLTQSSSFTDTNTFYTHTLAATATLTQSSTHTNTATFYEHALAATITLDQSSTFTDTNTFFAHDLTQAEQTLTQSATFTDSNSFYTHALSFDQVLAQGDIFVDTNSFYTHNLTYPQTLTQSSTYSNTNSFYTHSVSSSSFTPEQLAEILAYIEANGVFRGLYVDATDNKVRYLWRI